ncbi:MAG: hypothetical protein ACI4JY_10625 [Oscillospiraceae bacterium]
MRSIEEMQSSINNIREEMQSLWHDLDDLRNEKNGGAFPFDIDELAVMAKHNPITPHPLRIKDKHTKRCYITLLLSVAQFEPKKLKESLSMAHAIAYGCGYIKEGNLLDEYTSSHMLTFTQIDEIVALFAHDDLRLMLVEEMLLMAGRFEKGLKSAVEYISQICFLLKISADELTFLSQMSAVILSGNLDLYKCGIVNKYNLFDCYLRKFDFLKRMTVYTLQLPLYHQNDQNLRFCGAILRLENKKLIVDVDYSARSYLSFPTTLWKLSRELNALNGSTNQFVNIEYDVSDQFILFAEHITAEQRQLPVGVILHPLECKQSVDMEKVKKAYELHQGVL